MMNSEHSSFYFCFGLNTKKKLNIGNQIQWRFSDVSNSRCSNHTLIITNNKNNIINKIHIHTHEAKKKKRNNIWMR